MNAKHVIEAIDAENAKGRLIVCAALRAANGRIICGPRHYDPIMREQISASDGPDRWRAAEQGFVDQRGVWLTREEALQLATSNGQRKYRCGGDEHRLYSENLY